MTSTRSLPTAPADVTPKKRFGLSLTQIAAAGFASITATVILSFFSISGTLIGAAVFSMASAVGNAVYGQSLRRTQDRVLDVVPFGGKADPASPTVVLDVIEDDAPGAMSEDDPPALPAATPAPAALSSTTWKRIVLFAVVLFAFVMAVVTTVELVAGRPLTDVLRGERGTGTSIGGGGRAPAPTVTRTVTPSVVVTTPTVTRTAPAVTSTAPPSGTTTVTPSTGAPSTTAPTTSGNSGSATTSGTPTSGVPTPTSSSSP